MLFKRKDTFYFLQNVNTYAFQMFKKNLKGFDLSIFTNQNCDFERNEFHKKNHYQGFSEVEKELLTKSLTTDNLLILHQSYGRAGVQNKESKNFKVM